MRPIDAHVHVGDWGVMEFGGRQSTPAEAAALYLRYNWAGAILFPTDLGESRELLGWCRQASGPVLFRAGFWADPRRPGNLDEYQAFATDYAVLKLHPSCLRLRADAPELAPYWEVAAGLGQPVVVHCGRWQEMAGYAIAIGRAADFPTVPVILAHMGGNSPHLVRATVAAVEGRDNLFLGSESIREPWLLEEAVARLGAGRLVFGSDYNLNHPESFRRLIEVLDIGDSQREMIFRNNINGLLRREQRFF